MFFTYQLVNYFIEMSEESSDLEIFCVGLNHETAPVSIRERMSISESELSDKCSLITSEEGFLESVIISTCNRIELYLSLIHI